MTTPVAFLDLMFPGDADRMMPSFSALGLEALASLETEIAALAPHLNEHGETLAPLNDINDKLKALRKLATAPTQSFTMAALEAYFTNPSVISALRGDGPTELFPHSRSLPDIDYDLLEPVLERFSES